MAQVRTSGDLAQLPPQGVRTTISLLLFMHLFGLSIGLAAYASAQQLLALTLSDGRLTLWSREGGREMILAQISIASAEPIQLRMVRTPEAGFRFSFRTGEGEWQPVITSSGTDAVHKPNSNPIRIALITTGSGGASARFGYLKIERW